MALDPAAERDLLANLGAHRVGQHDLRDVGLGAQHLAASRQGANVHNQHLILGKTLHLVKGKQALFVYSSLLAGKTLVADNKLTKF